MSVIVGVYFDFVSPYSYLGLARLPELERNRALDWEPRPVVYGALLDATGLVGPAEIDAKRRYTFLDVARAAALAGVHLVGPPAHPFRSLEALRMVTALPERGERRRLAVQLGDARWARGRDLTDPAVLIEEATTCGLDGVELERASRSGRVKRALRESTSQALAAGVFGVPTFSLDGELFWGHDRIPHLLARLDGSLPDLRPRIADALARPRGADRAGKPEAR